MNFAIAGAPVSHGHISSFSCHYNRHHRFSLTKFLSINCQYYLSVLTCVLGAQKNRLIETVLLSTHSICFG